MSRRPVTGPARPAGDSGECPRCKGKGWTSAEDPRPGNTCDDCNGTGVAAPSDDVTAWLAALEEVHAQTNRPCMCGKPEADPVHHRPQTSDQEHAYEPAPTEAEFYGQSAQPVDVSDDFEPAEVFAALRRVGTPDALAPEQAGGQRAADNRQRAAELLPEDVFAKCRHERVAEIAAALDAAEARGRAEVAAKVEALAAEVQSAVPGLARRLRALVAALAPGAQTDGEAGRG